MTICSTRIFILMTLFFSIQSEVYANRSKTNHSVKDPTNTSIIDQESQEYTETTEVEPFQEIDDYEELHRRYSAILSAMARMPLILAKEYDPRDLTEVRAQYERDLDINLQLRSKAIGLARVLAPGIRPVLEDHLRFNELPENFKALGHMYEAAGLIWSGAPNQEMSQSQARTFCSRLGRGIRLPTKTEYRALIRAMRIASEDSSFETHASAIPLPETPGKNYFWSSTPHFHVYKKMGYVFHQFSETPFVYKEPSKMFAWVRCVLDQT